MKQLSKNKIAKTGFVHVLGDLGRVINYHLNRESPDTHNVRSVAKYVDNLVHEVTDFHSGGMAWGYVDVEFEFKSISNEIYSTIEDLYDYSGTITYTSPISYNHYPSGPCKPEDGVVYLALGLGKAIVDGGSSYCFCLCMF